MRQRKKTITNWDKVYRQNYETHAFSDIYWIRKAKNLLESAKLIEPEVIRLWKNYRRYINGKTDKLLTDYYQGTYFMLVAYAVENLLKATVIQRNSFEYKKKFHQTLKFPKELQSHDLVKLARKADLDFTIEEEDLLRRLTRSATWDGRYPIPLHYKQMSGAECFSDGKEYSVSWFGGDDIDKLNKFIKDLKEKLDIREI